MLNHCPVMFHFKVEANIEHRDLIEIISLPADVIVIYQIGTFDLVRS